MMEEIGRGEKGEGGELEFSKEDIYIDILWLCKLVYMSIHPSMVAQLFPSVRRSAMT